MDKLKFNKEHAAEWAMFAMAGAVLARGDTLRGAPPSPFGVPTMKTTYTSGVGRISLEFREGFEAYGDGIDGYSARPYPDCTQPMTDWFAGWIAAKNEDKDEVAA